jgi:hypothetical protein
MFGWKAFRDSTDAHALIPWMTDDHVQDQDQDDDKKFDERARALLRILLEERKHIAQNDSKQKNLNHSVPELVSDHFEIDFPGGTGNTFRPSVLFSSTCVAVSPASLFDLQSSIVSSAVFAQELSTSFEDMMM